MNKTYFHRLKRLYDIKHLVCLVLTILIIASLTLNANTEETEDPADAELLENLAQFSEILAYIKQQHLEAPETKELIEGAITGMLRTLDPYSQFIPDYLELSTKNRGNYAGLGMTIGIREDMLTVITPFKGSPAAAAGMQSGDIISQIEGESTAVMSLDDAVGQLRGEPGTAVSITIIRAKESQPIELTITRDVIRIPSVEKAIIGNNIGYLKINQFIQTTASDVDAALLEFQAQQTRGVILDLRFNPGGLLTAAIDIASDFLEPGQLVVYSQGKQKQDFNAKGIARDKFPLIVLVNSGSASASEIVAGAIKDHGRGLVMGQKTFGKASVQRIWQLSNSKAAIKLTVANYYTPNGTNIDKIGITPDIESDGFSRSEQQMQLKLREHEKIKTFIAENGDDVLAQLETVENAPRDDRQASKLLRTYQRLVDELTEEQIILSEAGMKYAIAQITENTQDELEQDPQVVAAMKQLKVLELFSSKSSRNSTTAQ